MKKLCKNCIYDSLNGTIKSFKQGEVIFREGAPLDHIAMINSGLVKVSKLFVSGEEKIFDILGPREYVGLVAMLKGEDDFIATATALSNVTLNEIHKSTVMTTYDSDDFFKDTCLNCTMTRMGTFQTQLFQSANLDTEDKILHILEYLAKKFGRKDDLLYTIHLPFTKTVLAGLIGIRRETLSRHLSSMLEEGLIDIEKNIYKFVGM